MSLLFILIQSSPFHGILMAACLQRRAKINRYESLIRDVELLSRYDYSAVSLWYIIGHTAVVMYFNWTSSSSSYMFPKKNNNNE